MTTGTKRLSAHGKISSDLNLFLAMKLRYNIYFYVFRSRIKEREIGQTVHSNEERTIKNLVCHNFLSLPSPLVPSSSPQLHSSSSLPPLQFILFLSLSYFTFFQKRERKKRGVICISGGFGGRKACQTPHPFQSISSFPIFLSFPSTTLSCLLHIFSFHFLWGKTIQMPSLGNPLR